ncbi:succinyl-CoA synthetase beta subunit [Terrimicrobium sacchariphilum]|jgi:succinyl-CoA synthetase beta subunit|uniref:Succinate--CoA ligase [ADP-forming] subunit beta n=1 Tax=Terrimicrobium sacchariphilum TaxID=690879 RepID=A0A146G5K2_TERSA|nr:ADP-forming succinate--CoA ligase subunit beta [Terrimicrobium sacchariphilum]GAT32026.1 succinyl-CoA synthetase beta subunit [Terrimicrobium sacchariphilum]
MNIHEYQARELFAKFGVATQPGAVAFTPDEAEAVASKLGGKIVVKAQIHAGGRGKGTFKNGFKGGVHLCDTPAQARDLASQMLGQVLVTHQTGPEGKEVGKVFVGEAVDITKELYFAILLDRATSAPVVIASTEGGVDIESVAEHTPEKIIRVGVNPALGLMPFQSRKIAATLGLTGPLANQAVKLFANLYKLFIDCDCSMVEINPLVITAKGELLALDAKFNFDDNALYRQPAIVAMRDKSEEDPREVAASEYSLNYIGLDGNIACLVNGAGLAMATMDIIQYAGGKPANFLDVGGGASKDQVSAAFRIILGDANVKGILVNIFGGIMDCNIIANGIVEAARETSLSIPLVVRLEGNNVEAGKKTLAESGLALITGDDILDAAQKVVAAVAKAA